VKLREFAESAATQAAAIYEKHYRAESVAKDSRLETLDDVCEFGDPAAATL